MAIGFFDGVHAGHRRLLQSLVRNAREKGARASVLTFEPHPDRVIKGQAPPLLTDLEEKKELIASIGVREIVVRGFTPELAALSADEFVERVLWPEFNPAEVYVGYNFTFGRAGSGSPRLLRLWGDRLGFMVREFPPVLLDGEPVSSTMIRGLIEQGDVSRAAQCLERPYSLSGKVVPGDGRGAQLGFPTANIEVPTGRCLPANGVYAIRFELLSQGVVLSGVANLGVRPTFISADRSCSPCLEVHVFDFTGNLYGEAVRVSFIGRIRGEHAFRSAEELKGRIGLDIQEARNLLACPKAMC